MKHFFLICTGLVFAALLANAGTTTPSDGVKATAGGTAALQFHIPWHHETRRAVALLDRGAGLDIDAHDLAGHRRADGAVAGGVFRLGRGVGDVFEEGGRLALVHVDVKQVFKPANHRAYRFFARGCD